MINILKILLILIELLAINIMWYTLLMAVTAGAV